MNQGYKDRETAVILLLLYFKWMSPTEKEIKTQANRKY